MSSIKLLTELRYLCGLLMKNCSKLTTADLADLISIRSKLVDIVNKKGVKIE